MEQGPRVGWGQFSIKGSYSILPSEPIKVGHQHQLLMDDYIVDDAWDCRRIVHPPEKHPDNPLIKPGQSWEGPGPGNGTVLYDDRLGRFRLWANVWDEQLYKTKAPFSLRGIYYESEDGVHWDKPELGLIEWEGNKANNLFFGGDWLYAAFSVMRLPPRLSSKGRFMLLYSTAKAGG